MRLVEQGESVSDFDITPQAMLIEHRNDMLNTVAMMAILQQGTAKKMLASIEAGRVDMGALIFIDIAQKVIPGLVDLLELTMDPDENIDDVIIARSDEILDKYDPDMTGDIIADVEKFMKGES